ncbi:MAG: trypsin-like peptidase domain-containing protein [Clostridia bacterium]|nr:trypsin-like peptidase domain-containing protein [Clostridia bacterium]
MEEHENNTAYTTDSFDEQPVYEPKKKSPSDAGCLVAAVLFTLIAVLAAAVLVAVLVPHRNGNEQQGRPNTPMHSGEVFGSTEPDFSQNPSGGYTPMPVPTATTRPMTDYDGVPPVITDASNPFPEIISGVQSGVVSVYSYGNSKSIFGNTSMEVQGSGTGFVVSSDGYVITNAHVIADAVKVTLVLFDDSEVDCEVIGSDVATDIAVLKFDNTAHRIKPLYLGNSDNAKVGEFVITVGDPSGRELAGTITFGIISAVNRTVNIDGRTNTYIQTDAAMNPGNSGGPLINSKGEVIAVNSAKTVTASYDEYGNAISAEGLGFAIPMNTVKEIAESLITSGRIERPGIGVTIYPCPDEDLYKAGLDHGLMVESVTSGGPAEKAGIMAGDILTECNGVTLTANDDLTHIIANSKVGDVLSVTLVRNGKSMTLSITVGDLNAY